MIRIIALLSLFALCACASGGEPLAQASGPWHALNAPAQWQPSPADLQAIQGLPQ